MSYTNTVNPKLQYLVDKGYTHHCTVNGKTLLSGGKKYWCLIDRGRRFDSLVTEQWEAAMEFLSDSPDQSEMYEIHLGAKLQEELGSLSDKAMVHPSRPTQAILWTQHGWLHLGTLGEVTQHSSRAYVWETFTDFNNQLDLLETEALQPNWFSDDDVSVFNKQEKMSYNY